jgi:hypothetical protein
MIDVCLSLMISQVKHVVGQGYLPHTASIHVSTTASSDLKVQESIHLIVQS